MALIVYESSLSPSKSHAMAAEVTATPLKQTEMDVNHQEDHINKPSMADTMMGFNKRLPRHSAQGQQQEQHQQQHQTTDATSAAEHMMLKAVNSIKRSYSSSPVSDAGGHGLASTLKSLVSLTGLQHIRSGSGAGAASAPSGYGYGHHTQSAAPATHLYTEAKPIYEEQQDHEYAPSDSSTGSEAAATSANAGLHSAIYNLHTAGTHNAGLLGAMTAASSHNGGSDGFRPSWNFGKLRSTSFTASSGTSTPYNGYHQHYGGKSGGDVSTAAAVGGGYGAGVVVGYGGDFGAGNAVDSSGSGSNNDKISEGNFLHHYDSASGYNELTHQLQQQQQQQQQHQYQLQQQYPQYQPQYESQYSQQHHQDEYKYNSVEQAAEGSSSYSDEGDHHEHSNYLPSAPPSGGGVGGGSHHEEKQPDVINYVPYPVVKKLHVPVHEDVKIPVSHAVIVPIRKPVPIHIPITQNVQIPVEKDLKIPVERIVPYPVEKHVPVPVEKRVPYEVVKYVPIKVPRPFPVKVPVFKTVLHKVKGWW
uniref:Uncharacterized protein n=1 Tax=Stomoxys calcitrans TaxID=35570 RepID=A0A1I8PDL0_STOCA